MEAQDKAVRDQEQAFENFGDFYAFYLEEHACKHCRKLHFIGTTLSLIALFLAWWLSSPLLLLLIPVFGYSFAWIGHVLFEKNRPATFKHPVYSALADLVMYKDILIGRVSVWR